MYNKSGKQSQEKEAEHNPRDWTPRSKYLGARAANHKFEHKLFYMMRFCFKA